VCDRRPFRTLFVGPYFDVAEYDCPGTPAQTAVESAPYPQVVMVCVGAYVRRDVAGSVLLDRATIGFFEAGRPYTILHPAPRPDLTTVIVIKDRQALAEALGLTPAEDGPCFQRSAVRAPPEALVLHRALHRACSRAAPEAVEIEEIAAALILVACEANHDVVSPADTSAQQKCKALAIAEYIYAHFREPIALRDIGAAVSLSPFQICRVFRVEMRTTVHQRIMALRLDAAVEALLNTDAPITEIALDLGFSSHSHLTATMTRVMGVSPSAVRAGVTGARKILEAKGL
jgi:AraC-like DNA-binding protein